MKRTRTEEEEETKEGEMYVEREEADMLKEGRRIGGGRRMINNEN